jgi:hypothetical protein
MKDIIEKIFKSAKHVRLEKEKKNSIKASILMYMKENPVVYSKASIMGFWKLLFLPRLRPAYVSIASLALVLFVVGSASVGAQSALPGDLLYPVKVDFNEKILQVLAFSDQAKAMLHVQLAETRLQEVEKLVVEGKLTAHNQNQINDNLNISLNNATKSIDKLNSAKKYNSALNVSSDLEASLKVHSRVLQKIKDSKNNKSQDNVNSLIDKVDRTVTKTSNLSVTSANKELKDSGEKASSQEKVAQNHLKSAQNSINKVGNMVKAQENKIGADIANQIQNKLDSAEQLITQGKDKMNNKDYTGAILLFDQASVTAKESVNLMKVRKNLGIDINVNNNSNNQEDK